MSATCLRLAAAWPNLGPWCSNRPMTFGCLGSLPGQNVSVFVNLRDGDRQPRRYTVSSTAGGRDSRSAFGGARQDGCTQRSDVHLSTRQGEVGDILDVSAPAGDFVLTPSVFPASPGSRRGRHHDRAADRRARCADTATATSDGGPRRNVPLKIMRFARLGISSTISTPTPGMASRLRGRDEQSDHAGGPHLHVFGQAWLIINPLLLAAVY